MTQSKKEKTFRAAYNDYYALVFNIVRNRVRTWEDAEDICHDIFVDLFKQLDTVRNVRAWLLGAMTFAISNFYRKKANRVRDEDDIEDFLNNEALAFENGARDIRIVLKEAVNDSSLYADEQERILFELVAINNFTYRQAGKQLGLRRHQACYKFRKVCRRIVRYLYEKGITGLEDTL